MSEPPSEQAGDQANGESKTINFTDGESKIFMSIMKHLTGEIQASGQPHCCYVITLHHIRD